MLSNGGLDVADRWVSDKDRWTSVEELVLFLKQKKAYQYAGQHCRGQAVLDFGCGTGYGADSLAEVASNVVGVDISEEVIAYCLATYSRPNLSFKRLQPDAQLEIPAGGFDVIVSFQVIEHVPDVHSYLMDLKRVLKNTGVLFITTPNRRYRLLPFQKPWNPEHFREFDAAMLEREVHLVFDSATILGIQGNEEVKAIEYGRVRQTPLKAYLYQPVVRILRRILPTRLLGKIRELRHRPNSKTPRPPTVSAKYTVDDFLVGNDLEGCLDLLVVCRNSRPGDP